MFNPCMHVWELTKRKIFKLYHTKTRRVSITAAFTNAQQEGSVIYQGRVERLCNTHLTHENAYLPPPISAFENNDLLATRTPPQRAWTPLRCRVLFPLRAPNQCLYGRCSEKRTNQDVKNGQTEEHNRKNSISRKTQGSWGGGAKMGVPQNVEGCVTVGVLPFLFKSLFFH